MRQPKLVECGLVAGMVLFGAGSIVAAAGPETSVAKAGRVASASPLGALLYSQNDNLSASSTTSQNFEAANNAFDNELADDFVVPAGGWAINEIAVTGAYFNGPGPAPTVHVAFYNNSGTLPGAAIAACDYPAIVPVDTVGSFSMTLAPVCALAPGTYWVSVVANMDFAPNGQWGWTDRTVTSNSPAAWRNPGGGFATPCTVAFGARAATCGIGATAPDQMFSLFGVLTPVELQRFSVE